MEDVNKRRRISFFLSKLECGPQEINSREIRLHLPFSANWNKRTRQRLEKRKFILKLTFSLPLPSSMLRLASVRRLRTGRWRNDQLPVRERPRLFPSSPACLFLLLFFLLCLLEYLAGASVE